jgi:hypothetical protein
VELESNSTNEKKWDLEMRLIGASRENGLDYHRKDEMRGGPMVGMHACRTRDDCSVASLLTDVSVGLPQIPGPRKEVGGCKRSSSLLQHRA